MTFVVEVQCLVTFRSPSSCFLALRPLPSASTAVQETMAVGFRPRLFTAIARDERTNEGSRGLHAMNTTCFRFFVSYPEGGIRGLFTAASFSPSVSHSYLIVTISLAGGQVPGLHRHVFHIAAKLPSRVSWRRAKLMCTERRRRAKPNGVIGNIYYALLVAEFGVVGGRSR